MRYIKTFGLLVVTAVAAMALATTASATSLTSPEGTTYTGKITAEAAAGIILHNGPGTYECTQSAAEGTVEQHGSSVTAVGKLSKWTLTGCNMTTIVKKTGTVTIHTEGGSSNGSGTVTVTGSEVETIGATGTCIYTTNETDIGVLTGSNKTGGHAVLDLSGIVPRTGGSFFCGSGSAITGTYTITSPSKLYVD